MSVGGTFKLISELAKCKTANVHTTAVNFSLRMTCTGHNFREQNGMDSQ